MEYILNSILKCICFTKGYLNITLRSCKQHFLINLKTISCSCFFSSVCCLVSVCDFLGASSSLVWHQLQPCKWLKNDTSSALWEENSILEKLLQLQKGGHLRKERLTCWSTDQLGSCSACCSGQKSGMNRLRWFQIKDEILISNSWILWLSCSKLI